MLTIPGGHINPAVTLAMGVCGRLPLYLVPIYWAGQTVGAFLGSAVCYGVYYGESYEMVLSYSINDFKLFNLAVLFKIAFFH